MKYLTLQTRGAESRVSLFLAGRGRAEAHAIVRCTIARAPFAEQWEAVDSASHQLIATLSTLTGCSFAPVMRRRFLSDPTNQVPLIDSVGDCACGTIGQSPLDGTKVACLIWLQEDGECENLGRGLWRNKHGQMWQGDPEEGRTGDSATLTHRALTEMSDTLSAYGGSLADHCVRTWFVVRDVDTNYAGVVTARNEVFDTLGLHRDTHFIASTGIGGFCADPRQTVSFNAFSDLRITQDSVTYLKGSSHLNPTAEYGVAFERATAVDYADRREIFVSGTASIDNRGEIVAPGDIEAQTYRMLENIKVLLAEGDSSFSDVAHLIVYLRDAADSDTVESIFARELPEVPRVVVLAPVCRPGWLIETECIAVKPIAGDTPLVY